MGRSVGIIYIYQFKLNHEIKIYNFHHHRDLSSWLVSVISIKTVPSSILWEAHASCDLVFVLIGRLLAESFDVLYNTSAKDR
jgi:hypothetical protein